MKFSNFFDFLPFSEAILVKIVKVIFIFIIGHGAARIFKSLASDFQKRSHQSGKISYYPEFVFYITMSLTVLWALDLLNVDIKILLGTAGFLTVALGFAAQTSVSNIISGLFIMSERPFSIKDTVKINDFMGEIVSIDLLSTRIKTIDNLMVRIPNETLMKANIINFTHFPLRRVDIELKVSGKVDVEEIKNYLLEKAKKSSFCFDEPHPVFLLTYIGDYFWHIQFSFWVEKQTFLQSRSDFLELIMQDKEKVGLWHPIPRHEWVSDFLLKKD
jgi:small-conductance mechanosensitive channel